jgi:hypothetical protein
MAALQAQKAIPIHKNDSFPELGVNRELISTAKLPHSTLFA